MDEKLIVQVLCDREVGTAFYVAPDILITAWHTVSAFREDGNNIIKDTVDGNLFFTVDRYFEDADIAILKVEGRLSTDRLHLFAHHIRVREECSSFGYPDTSKQEGLRINGLVHQKVAGTTGDYRLLTMDVDANYNYQGMSGAPVFQNDKVIGVVIGQAGKCLTIISVLKIAEILGAFILPIEKEANLTEVPESIAKDIEVSHPNFRVIHALDERLKVNGSKWLLLCGSPGCGKTILSASFESDDENIEVLGRFFFKVPNDTISRAVRCSTGFFVNWLESLFIKRTGVSLEKLTFEDQVNRITNWLQQIGGVLSVEGKHGVLIIDGLDELVTDGDNRVDDFLSLLPVTMPDNISIVLSCISTEILPSYVFERFWPENCIEVTPLDMATCESFIQENSGNWDKPYSFIQAVASKTEGHPLYMNYLCRYISDAFDATTEESELNDWVASLSTISGDIRSYYETVWRKADPKGVAFEVMALLSQTRGPVRESQLIGMMKNPNPYGFKSAIKEFQHLMKEKGTEVYEIYHSSFRLFVTDKLSSILHYTNDQIATYCEAQKETRYAIENFLHHAVNGSNVKRGLTMCNQEWADRCAINDVSPDLVMQDIKECLSFAVDNNLPVEVVRLMLLAQRIETRCDSIMVDNAREVADLKILMGKPEIALKYLVRDNILLVGIERAISYLRCLFELGYDDEAYSLSIAIEAAIRKKIYDNVGKKSSPDVFVFKGCLIVEGIQSGYEDSNHLVDYFGFLDRLIDDQDEESINVKAMIREMILAYQLSIELRRGKKIDITKILEAFGLEWNEKWLILFVKALAIYDYLDIGLHVIGHNEAFDDCLRQVEEAMSRHSFSFTDDDLSILVSSLIDKKLNASVVQKILKDYGPKPEVFVFRNSNGVDFDAKSLNYFYQQSIYRAYLDENTLVPVLNKDYYSDSGWERYIESLIERTAYLCGVLYRSRASGKNYDGMYPFVKEVVDGLDFSFDQRIQWKRSYLLPEELFPFVYDKLAEIYSDFFEKRIDDFIEHLISRMPDQLCMYREGYCGVLIRLADFFVLKEKMQDIALLLADEAVRFTQYAVQNRGERCSYLLRICRVYALLHKKEKVDAVYQEVMNSSMGPDWYKEAQLEFINRFRNINISFERKQIGHLAAIFEEASGEMTFQRYVRQQKNEFVATIAKSSSLKDAINYYKYETLPSADRIIRNAEEWKVDMPSTGKGYDLGCNHLIEASALCQLLNVCKEISPYIRYAISELFWENWDKMHNDYLYAQLHAGLFAALGVQKTLSDLVPRIAEYFMTVYYRDKKGEYLKDLENSHTPMTVLDGLEESLNKLGYNWKRATPSLDKEMQGESPENTFADLHTSKAILECQRKEIVSPLGNYWYSLSEFIGPLINQADFNLGELLHVITDHYDANVRPTLEQFEKFEWFEGAHKEDDKDEQMIHFLIWFLLHPDRKISYRALESINWLVKYDERVIDCLIDEVLDPSETGLATKASAILLEMTQSYPQVMLEHIKRNRVDLQLLQISNFSVSRNLYEMAILFADICGNNDLLKELEQIIPEALPDRGEVWIDFSDMMFIEHIIDELNNLKVTGKDFVKSYLDEKRKLEEGGCIETLLRSDKYVRRSFYLNYTPLGRYGRAMTDVLDRVLYNKVDRARAGRVYYAIND